MRKHYLILWAAMGLLLCARPLRAAEGDKVPAKPCQGTLTFGGKTYQVTQAVAYPTKVFDEEGYALIVSDKPINVDALKKAALQKDDGKDDSFNLFQTHAKINFRKSGEVMFCNAWADNHSLSYSGSDLKGEIKIVEGRAGGVAKLEYSDAQDHKSGCDLKFDVPLLVVPMAKTTAKADKPDEADSEKSPDEKSPGKKKNKKANPRVPGRMPTTCRSRRTPRTWSSRSWST